MEISTPAPINLRHIQPLFLFIFLNLIAGVSSHLPFKQLAGSDCAGQIVRFSTCLPYVSSYPNNLSSTASSSCCDSISSAFGSGDGFCFCYLLRQPLVLGFPVNSSRILSLTSVCGPVNPSSAANATSLKSICDGSPALPPLRSGTIGPAFTNPNPSPAPVESGSPSKSITLSSPPDVADGIPAVKTPGPRFIANGDSSRCSFISFCVATMFFYFQWF